MGRAGCPKADKKVIDRLFPLFIRSLRDPSVMVRAAAAEALGHLGDAESVEPLLRALKDSNSRVQRNAIIALDRYMYQKKKIVPAFVEYILRPGSLQTSVAVDQLKRLAKMQALGTQQQIKPTQLMKKEAVTELLGAWDQAVGFQADQAVMVLLRSFEDERIVDLARKHIDDPSRELRQWALDVLERSSDERVVPAIIRDLKDIDPRVRRSAADSLRRFQDARALDALIETLKDPDSNVRAGALRSLSVFDDPRVPELNIEMLKDKDKAVRLYAMRNIKRKPDKRAVEPLVSMLHDPDTDLVPRAAEALAAIGDKRAVGTLIDTLGGKFDKNRSFRGDLDLREDAAESLSLLKDKRAVPALVNVVLNQSEDDYLRRKAAFALGEIGDPSGLKALESMSVESFLLKKEIEEAIRKLRGDQEDLGVDDVPGDKAVSEPPKKYVVKGYPVGDESADVTSLQAPTKMRTFQATREPEYAAKYRSCGNGFFKGTKADHNTLREEKRKSPQEGELRIGSMKKTSPDISSYLEALKNKDYKMRLEAADILGELGNKKAVTALIALLGDENNYVRQAGTRALGKLKDKEAVDSLIDRLEDSDLYVRAFSIWALGEIREPRAIKNLTLLLPDPEGKIRYYSFKALRKFSDPGARRSMVQTLISHKSESMLSWLISLEGTETIIWAYEDSQGDETKTVRNYIGLLETRVSVLTDIARKALREYENRELVICELSAVIKDGRNFNLFNSVLRELQNQY